MRLITIFQLINFSLLMLSCSNGGEKLESNIDMLTISEVAEGPMSNQFDVDKVHKQQDDEFTTGVDALKIIRNGELRIQVKNVEKTTEIAKRIASKYKGYISDERFENTYYAKENKFTIRVPKDSFDSVLDSICSLGEFIDHKNIATVDVSEEYVDVSARLKTKLEVKERYETILRTKAKSVEDVLLTEEKLRALQEEIEAAQSRLHYLSNRVSYSTIKLDIYETVIPKEGPQQYEEGFVDKALYGLSFGWNLLQYLFLALFYIWPLLIVGIVIYVYFKWIKKNRK